MINAWAKIHRLKNPVIVYMLLVFIMLLSKIFLRDWWLTDQYIMYNLLSLFILAFVTDIPVVSKKTFFKFIPVLIIFYFFFDPDILKKLFFLSHIMTLVLLFGMIKGKRLLSEPGAALIPIELIIIIVFL